MEVIIDSKLSNLLLYSCLISYYDTIDISDEDILTRVVPILRHFKIMHDEIDLDKLTPLQNHILSTAEKSIEIYNKLIYRSEQLLRDIKDIKEYKGVLDMIRSLEQID
jgi:hypothetical protein